MTEHERGVAVAVIYASESIRKHNKAILTEIKSQEEKGHDPQTILNWLLVHLGANV